MITTEFKPEQNFTRVADRAFPKNKVTWRQLDDFGRYPNALNIGTVMEDETNPYEPNASHGLFNESPNKLSEFFRGVRNGFFWSLPVFVSLTIFIATYGRKPPPIYAAMLEAFQIPAIWMLIAGMVAAVTDRRKP